MGKEGLPIEMREFFRTPTRFLFVIFSNVAANLLGRIHLRRLIFTPNKSLLASQASDHTWSPSIRVGSCTRLRRYGRSDPLAWTVAASPVLGINYVFLPTSKPVHRPHPSSADSTSKSSQRNYGEERMPQVSFASDIKPLFRAIDISHMKSKGVHLDDYTFMSDPNHANRVLATLSHDGKPPSMPPGGPDWTEAKLGLFVQSQKDGYRSYARVSGNTRAW